MGIELEKNIFTKINLSSLLPKKLEENNWAAFDGEFETNFILPNFIGIGNGITRGYGTLHGLFDLDEKDLRNGWIFAGADSMVSTFDIKNSSIYLHLNDNSKNKTILN